MIVDPTAEFIEAVRRTVDARLAFHLDGAEAQARACAKEALPVVEQVRELTMRGGKRLRAALVAAAVECYTPWTDLAAAGADVCAAIELLQTYLLVHDDWMDGDVVRRGGPTVHVALARRYQSNTRGAAAAILAGDYASSLAQDVLARAPVPPARLPALLRAYAAMQREVVLGQTLDLLESSDIDALHDLKTGSYTVRGPLALGHALAGGSSEGWSALVAFSAPLGVAFQYRDDLIGTFGDEKDTGKTAGSDLRAGKRTAPVKFALERLDGSGRRELESLLGSQDPSALDRARSLIERCGARDAVEARITELRARALDALESPALRPEGRRLLAALARMITERKK